MSKTRVFRYRIDILAALNVLGALGLQFTALLRGWPWYTLLPIMVLLRQVNLVEHNHAHLRVFYPNFLNELLGWMCFLSNGVPLEFYEIHHVKNHHRYTLRFDEKEQDWSSPFGFTGTRLPDRSIGKFYYILSFPILTACHCLIEIVRAPGSSIFRRYLRSASVITAISSMLLFINPLGFLLFFFIPWLVVVLGLGMNNFNHHHNCKMTTPFNSANVDLRLHGRSLGYNIGYHVAHHIKPSQHWSLLPAHHESIKIHIPLDNFRLPLYPFKKFG